MGTCQTHRTHYNDLSQKDKCANPRGRSESPDKARGDQVGVRLGGVEAFPFGADAEIAGEVEAHAETEREVAAIFLCREGRAAGNVARLRFPDEKAQLVTVPEVMRPAAISSSMSLCPTLKPRYACADACLAVSL